MKRAVALGTFDGLHAGHRAVLDTKGCELCVLTFRIPPKSVFKGKTELLLLPSDKESELKKIGAKEITFLEFSDVKNISADDFLNKIYESEKPDLISCGFDFRFGKDAKGDTETIEDFCKSKGIECKIAPAVFADGVPISSTDLRNQIKHGEIEKANKQISGGFRFSSPVLHGEKRGRTIGFPTVNQEYPHLLVVPKCGVYSSKTVIDGREYRSVTNIGYRPTFKTDKVFCESYILDFSETVYGKTATVKPQKFLREEKKFGSIEELKNAIENDIKNLV